jgi:hypothetical protein
MTDTNQSTSTAVGAASRQGPTTPTEFMRSVQTEVVSVIDTLPMLQRFAANRRLGKDVAATVTALAGGMMKAAAAAELAHFEQQMTARRMDAAAMLLLNRGTLLRMVVQTLSVTQGELFRLVMAHEERIDNVAGPWASAIRAKLATGQITEEQAAKRLARVDTSSDALREQLETDVGVLVDNFRQQLHAGLNELAQARG